jgi:hypothetical protein
MQWSSDEGLKTLSPDIFEKRQEGHECISKLFEDPDEKHKLIQNNINNSQIKKRMRLNSGSSSQS